MPNLSRRKFLYVGAGVAAATGLGYLSKDYWLHQQQTVTPSPTSTPIITESPQPTITETSTTTTSEKYSIKGKVFFDFNGNGKQDMDEEPLSDVLVQINTKTRKVAEAITDSSGSFKIDDLEEGIYDVYVIPPDIKYKWMCRSVKEIKATGVTLPFYGNSVENYYELDLTDSNAENPKGNLDEFNIGLMEGFATIPYLSGGDDIYHHVDVDPRQSHISDYKGGKLTYEAHWGTDFKEGQGTQICAVAPGAVVFAKDYEEHTGLPEYWRFKGKFVSIDHGNGLMSSYSHLSTINVEPTGVVLNPESANVEWVNRGDIIGSEGSSGHAQTPHLHLGMRRYVSKKNYINNGFPIDPFRNLSTDSRYDDEFSWGKYDRCYSNRKSLWTQDNTPHNPKEI